MKAHRTAERQGLRLSETAQTRPNRTWRSVSGLPPTAIQPWTSRTGSFMPRGEVWRRLVRIDARLSPQKTQTEVSPKCLRWVKPSRAQRVGRVGAKGVTRHLGGS